MELIVKFENNFGVNRIVPICERGKLLAKLIGYILKTQAETL